MSTTSAGAVALWARAACAVALRSLLSLSLATQGSGWHGVRSWLCSKELLRFSRPDGHGGSPLEIRSVLSHRNPLLSPTKAIRQYFRLGTPLPTGPAPRHPIGWRTGAPTRTLCKSQDSWF